MFKIDLKMTPLQYRAETWPTYSGHHTEHFGICHHFGKILDSFFLALCNRSRIIKYLILIAITITVKMNHWNYLKYKLG